MIAANENEEGAAKRVAYIAEMLEELVQLAAEDDFKFLAYLLDITRQEALSMVSRRGDSVQ